MASPDTWAADIGKEVREVDIPEPKPVTVPVEEPEKVPA